MDPEYVMDKMQFYEIPAIVNHLHKKNRDTYEAARLVAMVVAQSNSKKKLKATDIFRFPWDDEREAQSHKITDADIKRLKEKAKRYAELNYQTYPR